MEFLSTISRRRFLLTLPALAALPQLALDPVEAQSLLHPFRKKPVPPPLGFVYFGTDTAKGVSKGIYLSRFNTVTGHLSAPTLVAETVRPSFLARTIQPGGRRRIYAANEANDASATVSGFSSEPSTSKLHLINRVTSAGAGPAYLSLDATGRSAFVADYAGSAIATYRVYPDGKLSEPVERIDYKNPRFGHRGPVAARQRMPHPHSVHLSPDNRFLLVSDLGSDAISIFTVDTATARLGHLTLFKCRPGCGPRHIAFHPNRRWVYSINEIDSTIDHFLWTANLSRTHPEAHLVDTGHFVKTIARGFPAAKNTAAEVAISPEGNFLYASNRGEDTLVVFRIASADGSLSFVQRISCGGKTPRQFTLSPGAKASWLLCGNQDSATVTVFRRDLASGRIEGPIQTLPLDSVLFTLFA